MHYSFEEFCQAMSRLDVRTFFIIGIIASVVALVFAINLDEPTSYKGTESIGEGEYKSWDTRLGIDRGFNYRVEVVTGGPVDVYVTTDTSHPRLEIVGHHRHENVTVAEGKVDPRSMFVYIMVDNTDVVGGNTSGPVTVEVSYEALDTERGGPIQLCSGIFIVLFSIFLSLPFIIRYLDRRQRMVGAKPLSELQNSIARRFGSRFLVKLFFMAFLAPLILLTAIIIVQSPDTTEKQIVVNPGEHFAQPVFFGNKSVSYHMEVVSGGPIDFYLSDKGVHPAITIYKGHSHLGVMEAEGTVTGPVEELSFVVDNTDILGTPASERTEVVLTYTSSYSPLGKALWAIGAIGTVIGGLLLALSIMGLWWRGRSQRFYDSVRPVEWDEPFIKR